MRKIRKKNRRLSGILLILLGCLFLYSGIQRGEHLTIEQKSGIVCLECIGIG